MSANGASEKGEESKKAESEGSSCGKKAPRRVKTGCLTCRARKVKCDESSDPCTKCQGMLLLCEWPAGREVPEPTTASSATPLQRPPACVACRTARSKCSQQRPACERCLRLSITCEYPHNHYRPGLTPAAAARVEDRRIRGSRSTENHRPVAYSAAFSSPLSSTDTNHAPPFQPHPPHPPHPLDIGLPTLPEIEHHIDAYFTYVQPYNTNALFHRRTLLADLAAARLSPVLILALCAITERYFCPGSPHPQGSPRADMWLHQAMSALTANPDKSLDNVLIALLLARHCIHSAIHVYTWNLVAMANRQAIGIGLHRQDVDAATIGTEEHEADAERRRRIWWACYTLDRMMANGLPEFTLCIANRIKVALPGRDEVWAERGRCEGRKVVPKIQEVELHTTAEDFVGVGVMGHFARLVGVRYVIISSARTLQEGENILQPWEPLSTIQLSLTKLAHFTTTLHPSYILNPSTIHAMRGTDQLGPLIMLHMWYEMFHLELFRMAVPGYTESLPPRVAELAPEGWLDDMGARCLERGRNMMSLLMLVEQETRGDGWPPNLDPKLPMLIYASVRIQLELGKDVEKDEQLRKGLEVMLGCIDRIGRFYAIAKPLLRETWRMIRARGIPLEYVVEDDGSETPPHPWFKRLKKIEVERRTEEARRAELASVYNQDLELDPMQALFDDPGLSALFDMPDWLGGDFGMPLSHPFPSSPPHSDHNGPATHDSPQQPYLPHQHPHAYPYGQSYPLHPHESLR